MTSNVSFLLDRLQRGTFHEELHQLGSNPSLVRVPRRAGWMCDTLPVGWKVSDIYRVSRCRFQLGQHWWPQPRNLHRRLSGPLPNLSSRAESVQLILSYKSPSSSSEGWSWYSWGGRKSTDKRKHFTTYKPDIISATPDFFVPSSSFPYFNIRLLFYFNFVDSWFHYFNTSKTDLTNVRQIMTGIFTCYH